MPLWPAHEVTRLSPRVNCRQTAKLKLNASNTTKKGKKALSRGMRLHRSSIVRPRTNVPTGSMQSSDAKDGVWEA
jgi:hypothetical protein